MRTKRVQISLFSGPNLIPLLAETCDIPKLRQIKKQTSYREAPWMSGQSKVVHQCAPEVGIMVNVEICKKAEDTVKGAKECVAVTWTLYKLRAASQVWRRHQKHTSACTVTDHRFFEKARCDLYRSVRRKY